MSVASTHSTVGATTLDSPVGQRRHLTLWFADLSDSTELSEVMEAVTTSS